MVDRAEGRVSGGSQGRLRRDDGEVPARPARAIPRGAGSGPVPGHAGQQRGLPAGLRSFHSFFALHIKPGRLMCAVVGGWVRVQTPLRIAARLEKLESAEIVNVHILADAEQEELPEDEEELKQQPETVHIEVKFDCTEQLTTQVEVEGKPPQVCSPVFPRPALQPRSHAYAHAYAPLHTHTTAGHLQGRVSAVA